MYSAQLAAMICVNMVFGCHWWRKFFDFSLKLKKVIAHSKNTHCTIYESLLKLNKLEIIYSASVQVQVPQFFS